jgi:hypothetical protein
MKYLEDAAYVLLLVALMPLLIVLLCPALIAIMARRMYWSMRGHSTNLTRRRARRRPPLAGLWSWLRGRLPSAVSDAAPDRFPATALRQAQDEAAP